MTEKKEYTCPFCNGIGRKSLRVCPKCNGEGMVSKFELSSPEKKFNPLDLSQIKV